MFSRITSAIWYKPSIDDLLKEFIKSILDYHVHAWQDTILSGIDNKNISMDDQILKYIIAYSNAWFDDLTGCDYISNKIEDILYGTGVYNSDDIMSIRLSAATYKDFIYRIFSKKDVQLKFLVRLVLSNILNINKENIDYFLALEMALPITHMTEKCSLIVSLARKHKLIPKEMISRVPISYR